MLCLQKLVSPRQILPQFLLLTGPPPHILVLSSFSLLDGQLAVYFVSVTVAVFILCTHHSYHSSLFLFLYTLGFLWGQ